MGLGRAEQKQRWKSEYVGVWLQVRHGGRGEPGGSTQGDSVPRKPTSAGVRRQVPSTSSEPGCAGRVIVESRLFSLLHPCNIPNRNGNPRNPSVPSALLPLPLYVHLCVDLFYRVNQLRGLRIYKENPLSWNLFPAVF